MNIREAIKEARRFVEKDPHLANYVLRDTQEVKDAGLSDLAWAMHRETPHEKDVLFLIEELEKYLDDDKSPGQAGETE